jgi:hypothetical protein
MAQYVTDYRARGNAAMVVFDDRGTVQSSEAFDAMLRDSSYVFSVVPSLAEYLLGYPRRPLPDALDVIFWSRDEMPKLRPVVRITHQVIYSPADVPDVTLVAAKQIYANHYFEAGLEVLGAADRATPSSTTATPGIILIAVRRYRFDHLPSGGVLNIRVVPSTACATTSSQTSRASSGERICVDCPQSVTPCRGAPLSDGRCGVCRKRSTERRIVANCTKATIDPASALQRLERAVPGTMIRVMTVDDHRSFRYGLAALLAFC